MIRLNLSEAIDIDYLLQTYYLNKLYLGYVKGCGYILIHEYDRTASFKCIESNRTPDDLNKNWYDDTKEIKEIYSELDKIFKDYITETLKGNKGDYNQKIVSKIYVDIVSKLLTDLEKKYITHNYIKVKNIENSDIKHFTSNPVESFKYYSNLKTEPLPSYANAHEDVVSEIESCFTMVIDVFNKNKSLKAIINKNGDTKEIITENEFIKIFNSIICDAFGNPLLNLIHGNGKQKINLIESIKYVTYEFNIKGVYKDGAETIYFYNDELKYFEPLTDVKLKNLVSKKLGLTLLKEDYSKIFNSIETTNKEYNNLLVFNNMLFDMDTMQELNYPDCNYNRCNYLAPALIGFEKDNNKIQLLEYDPDFEISEIYKTDKSPNMTFTEKTLRQILIPKSEPNNLLMFHDFLQRLGACILGKNKYKTITVYFNEKGNNGKSVLKLLFELIYNTGAYSLTPDTFKETFNLQSFINRKVLLLDEIDKNDFKDMKPTLKRISSPDSRIEQRGLYSTENIILRNYPMLFIFSNELIKLNMSETPLFNRIDFLELPNCFVPENELNDDPNNYLIDNNTENKLKNDYDGLSWLITASIKAFIDMNNKNTDFYLKQTASQTMDILLKTDYLTKFISLYTEIDLDLVGNECTTNEEILQQYKQYLELIGTTTTETDNIIKRRIGATIKQVYKIEGKITDSEIYYKQNNTIASYKIKFKTNDELTKEFNTVFIINEYATERELITLDYSTDNRLVYNKIQNGINTINLLNETFPDFDNNKIINELLNLNLIVKTNETNIMDYK